MSDQPHAFVVGKFKFGDHGMARPDEECDVCGRDPRNQIHQPVETSKREQPAWQVVYDIPGERVRRFATPSGWLYQVERIESATSNHFDDPTITTIGWHPPVHVPAPYPIK